MSINSWFFFFWSRENRGEIFFSTEKQIYIVQVILVNVLLYIDKRYGPWEFGFETAIRKYILQERYLQTIYIITDYVIISSTTRFVNNCVYVYLTLNIKFSLMDSSILQHLVIFTTMTIFTGK